ncbi:MAG: hypothetical protein KJ888_21090 [Gammaproteobacteria bacterium]|uniref:Uncharacterized protein n=1 Tax=viral metagenome TaxID=1070528 RepID=A0A6M3LGI1_9ZZZZ|nr:hypothetical protein [Gammaproteobacteria bacterium]
MPHEFDEENIKVTMFPFDSVNVTKASATLPEVTWDNYRHYFKSGLREKVYAVSAAYAITDTDGYRFIDVTTGSSNRTVTLPTASANSGRMLTVTKVDSGTGYVTVDGEGAETIGGHASLYLTSQYGRVTVYCDGTAWWVVSGVSTTAAANTAQANLLVDCNFVAINVNPADTNWHEVDISGSIPAGTTWVYGTVAIQGTSVEVQGLMSDTGTTTDTVRIRTQTANVINEAGYLVKLSPTGSIFYKVSNANIDLWQLLVSGAWVRI